jgi:hypothetical protein
MRTVIKVSIYPIYTMLVPTLVPLQVRAMASM